VRPSYTGPADYLFDERIGALVGVAGALWLGLTRRPIQWAEVLVLLLLLPAAGALIPLGWRQTVPWSSPRHFFNRWARGAAPVVPVLAVVGVVLQLTFPDTWSCWWHWPLVGLVTTAVEPSRHLRSQNWNDWMRRLRTRRGREHFALWVAFWLAAGFVVALAVELS
jgi:hypothetical protein